MTLGKNDEWGPGAVMDDCVEGSLMLGTNGEWRSGAMLNEVDDEVSWRDE